MKKFFIILLVLCISFSLCYSVYAETDDELTINYNPDDVNVKAGTNNVSIMKISSSDTTGLHSLLLRLIGDYNPIVKDYTYTSSNGYTSHSIDISPDWSWIMTAALFIIVIYCLFRFLGGIFS